VFDSHGLHTVHTVQGGKLEACTADQRSQTWHGSVVALALAALGKNN